jgi:hypothetical protein
VSEEHFVGQICLKLFFNDFIFYNFWQFVGIFGFFKDFVGFFVGYFWIYLILF